MTNTDEDINTIRGFRPECFVESRKLIRREDDTCWITTTVSFDIKENIKSDSEIFRPHVKYNFRYKDSQIKSIYKLKENKTYTYEFDAQNPNWIEYLSYKLSLDNFNDFAKFEEPKKKTAKSKRGHETISPTPISNSFSVLENSTEQTNEMSSFMVSTYKERLPSVYLPYPNKDRTMLDTLRNTISKDTKFELKGSSLKVQPTIFLP